jgi:hypothetical protein
MNDAQLNVRMDRTLKEQFVVSVERHGDSVARVIERFATAYVKAGDSKSIIHLDGNPCPLQQLIDGLATQAAAAMAMRIHNDDQPQLKSLQ